MADERRGRAEAESLAKAAVGCALDGKRDRYVFDAKTGTLQAPRSNHT